MASTVAFGVPGGRLSACLGARGEGSEEVEEEGCGGAFDAKEAAARAWQLASSSAGEADGGQMRGRKRLMEALSTMPTKVSHTTLV